MNIVVALDGSLERNLTFSPGDDQTLNVTVYRNDGDETPLTYTNPQFSSGGSALFPIGSQFQVQCVGRTPYRIAVDIDGVTTTVAYGVIESPYNYPFTFNCCWNGCGGIIPRPIITAEASNIHVSDFGEYFVADDVEDVLQEFAVNLQAVVDDGASAGAAAGAAAGATAGAAAGAVAGATAGAASAAPAVELATAQAVIAVDAAASVAGQSRAIAERNVLAPRATNEPHDDYDKPDGTLINGLLTISGHPTYLTGDGTSVAQTQGGALVSAGNLYLNMISANQIYRVEGVFSFLGADDGAYPVLMFNNSPDGFNRPNLVHLEITRTGVSLKRKLAPATVNTSPTGTIRERNGLENTETYLSPLRIDGTPYQISMEYIVGATDVDDVIAVFMPDGRVLEYSGDAQFRSILTGAKNGVWQLTGSGTAARWHSIGIGPTRAAIAGRVGNAIAKTESTPLLNMSTRMIRRRSVSVVPTAAEWYTFATALNFGSPNVSGLVGRCRVLGRTNSGRQTFAEFYLNAFNTGRPEISMLAIGLGSFGSAGSYVVSAARLSNDGTASGAKQFDLLVSGYSNSSDRLTVEFDNSILTPFASPVAGAVPLVGGVSRVQSIATSIEVVATESTGVARTFTPGVDAKTWFMATSYAADVTFLVDDAMCLPTDKFRFIRATGLTNNAIFRNASNNSLITTILPGTWVDFGVVGGKYVPIGRGTI